MKESLATSAVLAFLTVFMQVILASVAFGVWKVKTLNPVIKAFVSMTAIVLLILALSHR